MQRELVLKAKEMFVTNGPWLVHGSLEKLKVTRFKDYLFVDLVLTRNFSPQFDFHFIVCLLLIFIINGNFHETKEI